MSLSGKKSGPSFPNSDCDSSLPSFLSKTYEHRRNPARSRISNGKKRGLHDSRIRECSDRESVTGFGRERRCRRVWLVHEVETAGTYHHARATLARCATIRRINRARRREGAERIKNRDHAVGRWED